MTTTIKVPRTVYDAMVKKVEAQVHRLERVERLMAEKTAARVEPERAALTALQEALATMEPDGGAHAI